MKLLIMNKINTKFLSVIIGIVFFELVSCKHQFQNQVATQKKVYKRH